MHMIFVAYSHKDEKWLTEFETMAAPLKKYGGLKPQSDKDIKSSEDWRKRIDEMLKQADVAILLVSRHFLSSHFITTVELPQILKARNDRGLKIIWVLVSQCLWEETELEKIQSPVPTSIGLQDMSEGNSMAALKKVCGVIKEVFEKPALNKVIQGVSVGIKAEHLKVLERPCTRRVEVFIRADNSEDWWHQGWIDAGKQNITCHFGTAKTPPNVGFHIIGMTTEAPVPHQGGKPTKPLPKYRQLSDGDVRVIRKK
jgi:hypothetical protein